MKPAPGRTSRHDVVGKRQLEKSPGGIEILTPDYSAGSFGDIDQDGVLDGRDIQAFVKVATEPASASPAEIVSADINGDGVINMSDAAGLVDLLLGASG